MLGVLRGGLGYEIGTVYKIAAFADYIDYQICILPCPEEVVVGCVVPDEVKFVEIFA